MRPRRARCRSGSPRRSTSTRSPLRSSSRSEKGTHPAFDETRAARGELQFDAWGVDSRATPRAGRRCARGSASTACATRCWSRSRRPRRSRRSPAATSASSRRCRTCSSARRCRATSSRSTATWCDELKALGLWNEPTRARLKLAEGSVQAHRRAARGRSARVYRTAWELPMRSLIDMAADRGAFIDQSQSLNLFVESPNIGAALGDVLLRLEEGPQDHVLPALAPGDADREGDGRDLRPQPSRARSRTPRPARPASEPREPPCAPPRSGHVPHAAADGVPDVLRDVPRRDQEHLDRRGGRLLHRRRRSAHEDDATPSATSSSGWSRSSPPATRSSRTTSCSTSTSTSTRPRRGCTCRASSTRRRCTSSST